MSSIRELKEGGFTPLELKGGGLTAQQLRGVFHPKYLRGAGYTSAEVTAAGVSLARQREYGFAAEDCKAAGFSALELREVRGIVSGRLCPTAGGGNGRASGR